MEERGCVPEYCLYMTYLELQLIFFGNSVIYGGYVPMPVFKILYLSQY